MKKLNIPKVGLRNIKTALSVFICMIIFQSLGRNNAFYACIAAVICMKDTVHNSFVIGLSRLQGTFLGGLIGILAIYFLSLFPDLYVPNSLCTAIGVILVIYICTLLNKPSSVTIACIVFIGIMINYNGSESYNYAITRTIDTAIGVIVTILVNKYITPPKKDSICQ